jgi:hypothetical protein
VCAWIISRTAIPRAQSMYVRRFDDVGFGNAENCNGSGAGRS